ncbi:hypothetical protein [Actinomadura rubrisoli]|uniref:Uncharacterized protein n=1 Tax=Actinomadura rubrisoli TaxID=2530368 RepID=A0A4V2YRF0_9ACTN|nr:hypothetical protein [Actinomadura rubrisoli]TDD65917.1 hypothetical protein E1298_40925 [Actinomadura rubrisoli]
MLAFVARQGPDQIPVAQFAVIGLGETGLMEISRRDRLACQCVKISATSTVPNVLLATVPLTA